MLAHHQGRLFNVAQLARNLGVDAKTAHRYIDLLCGLLLVRKWVVFPGTEALPLGNGIQAVPLADWCRKLTPQSGQSGHVPPSCAPV